MRATVLVVSLLITVVNAQFGFLWSGNENRAEEKSRDGGFMSSISSRINAAEDLGRWLTASNPDFEDMSDANDVKVSEEMSRRNEQREREYAKSGRSDESGASSSMIDSIFKGGRKFFSGSNSMRLFYEAFVGVSGCLIGQEFNDTTIGTIPLNASYYCDWRCGRMIPGVTCCTPQSPDVINPKLVLYRPGEEKKFLNWRDASEGELLRNETRVVFVVHGYLEKPSYCKWIADFRDGYNKMGYAVITVDWRGGNSLQYWQAAANVRTVGAILGHAIGSWGIADKTLFVGFSLGGQMIAETSKYLDLKFGVKIDECHGLDPAGPFYDGCSEDMLLDRSHCKLVKVIHTSSADVPVMQTLAVRFGSYKKSGHCDYWVNCGHNQGPCTDVDFLGLIKGLVRLGVSRSDSEIYDWAAGRLCSHWRSPYIYSAALNKERTCPAINCPGCGRSKHWCTPENGTELVGDDYLPPSTLSKCTPNDNINYYVQSNSHHPFCLA